MHSRNPFLVPAHHDTQVFKSFIINNPDCNGFWGEHLCSPLQAPKIVGVDHRCNPYR